MKYPIKIKTYNIRVIEYIPEQKNKIGFSLKRDVIKLRDDVITPIYDTMIRPTTPIKYFCSILLKKLHRGK